MSFFGDSGGSRTHNLLLRTELLYPIELPSRASGRIALAQILIASEFWKAIAYQAPDIGRSVALTSLRSVSLTALP